jgi:hypothetical protein
MDEWEIAHSGAGGGMALLSFVAIVLIVILAVAWMTAPESPPPRLPAPQPAPPPPPAPGKAPSPPVGVSATIEAELKTLQRQIDAYAQGHVEPILTPALARVLGLVKGFEARVEEHHEKCRRMIEK